MKKATIFLVFLILSAASFAQTYLDVSPGYGTLNDAITANKGNVIYRLEAGGWYTLNAQIENNGFELKIVGTTPASGQMPATLQTGTKPDGTVLSTMFSVLGNISIKNVFIVNADGNNTIGYQVFNVVSSTSCRVVLDSVTCDPVGSAYLIRFNATPYPKFYATNCLFIRTGNLDGANDGWFFDQSGAPNNGFDTLYFENNTIMCTGTGIGSGSSFTSDSSNFVWVNHNSFIFHKSQLFWFWRMNSYFVTNNLFFDFDTQPWAKDWNVFFPDGSKSGTESTFALINQDTASCDTVNGQLLSSRKLFVEYNTQYLDPRIEAYTTTWAQTHTVNNDGVTPLAQGYVMDLGYPSDSAGVNREANMYGSPNFPYFHFGNFNKNVDPKWTDSKFYKIQDSLYLWTLPAAELNTWGFSASNVNPQPNAAGNWFWSPDNNYGNPTTWPRVNASYSNSALLTASIEGLPLGDLNWFPAQKATWLKNQAAVQAHILSENTSVINLTTTANTWSTIDDYDNSITYGTSNWETGEWDGYYSTSCHYTWQGGSTATCKFTGTGIKWIAATNADHGKAEVYIDGSYRTIVDLYSDSGVNQAVVYADSLLSSGEHTIEIKVTGTKGPNSRGSYVDIDAFQIAQSITGVKKLNSNIPTSYALSQNYPNPFNPTTQINYSVPKSGLVTVKIYNLLGQEVNTLVSQQQKAGNYTVNFNASKLASGVYMYRIQAGDFSLTKKMTLLK